jgi:hypothetical protein
LLPLLPFLRSSVLYLALTSNAAFVVRSSKMSLPVHNVSPVLVP